MSITTPRETLEEKKERTRLCVCGASLFVEHAPGPKYRIACYGQAIVRGPSSKNQTHTPSGNWTSSPDDAWLVYDAVQTLKHLP